MNKKIVFTVLLITILLLSFLAVGCSTSESTNDTTDSPSLRSGLPSVYDSAVEEFNEEMTERFGEPLDISDPLHTVEFDDHIDMFFVDRDTLEDPYFITTSFVQTEDGEYCLGSWEYINIYTTEGYGGDIPAAFWYDPDYQYGCCWIIAPEALAEDLYAEKADKKIKVDEDRWVYIDNDTEGGMDNPVMQEVWSFFESQGLN